MGEGGVSGRGREGLSDEVTLEVSEGTSQMGYQEKKHSGQRKHKCTHVMAAMRLGKGPLAERSEQWEQRRGDSSEEGVGSVGPSGPQHTLFI